MTASDKMSRADFRSELMGGLDAPLGVEDIRERIGQVKADQKARGRYLGGKVPFGFRVAMTVNSSLTRPSRRRFAKWRLCGLREDRSGPLPRRRKPEKESRGRGGRPEGCGEAVAGQGCLCGKP
jgi:hypothetical protein